MTELKEGERPTTTLGIISGISTGTNPSTTGTIQPPKASKHLYEVDVIRAVTALCVIGVHVLAFALLGATGPLGEFLRYDVKSSLHFTREIFLSISAFVLVMVYGKRTLSAKTFWKKRGIGVLLPYIAWSLFYERERTNGLHLSPLRWTGGFLLDLVTGKSSYQLYFILLTLEFYLILPWFLQFIKRAGTHPWRLLAISFGLQVALFVWDFNYAQLPPLSTTSVGHIIIVYQDNFLPVYQFYVILGGLAALHMEQLRAFVIRHGVWTILATAVSLTLLLGNLWYQTYVTHRGMVYGSTVFQPAMPLYAFSVSVFLYWIAYRWSISRAPSPPRGFRVWGLLSDISFGIYLLHVYILNRALIGFLPSLPDAWPAALRIFLLWVVVAGLTCVICAVMLYTPGLSRLIGRPCALPRDRGLGAWISKLNVAVEQQLRRGSSKAWALVAGTAGPHNSLGD
jgi:membrane-bound acyltransferase YfiQ involved in biofilm formation